jgi:hypothetical protein
VPVTKGWIEQILVTLCIDISPNGDTSYQMRLISKPTNWQVKMIWHSQSRAEITQCIFTSTDIYLVLSEDNLCQLPRVGLNKF